MIVCKRTRELRCVSGARETKDLTKELYFFFPNNSDIFSIAECLKRVSFQISLFSNPQGITVFIIIKHLNCPLLLWLRSIYPQEEPPFEAGKLLRAFDQEQTGLVICSQHGRPKFYLGDHWLRRATPWRAEVCLCYELSSTSFSDLQNWQKEYVGCISLPKVGEKLRGTSGTVYLHIACSDLFKP